MAEIRYKGQIYSGAASFGSADDVSYDNTNSGLTATDVQGAVDEVCLKTPLFDRGSYTQTLSATGSTYDKNVTFTTAFPSAPTVVVSISDVGRGSASAPKTAAGAMSVSTTGFVCRVKSDSVTAGDITVSWIAIL